MSPRRVRQRRGMDSLGSAQVALGHDAASTQVPVGAESRRASCRVTNFCLPIEPREDGVKKRVVPSERVPLREKELCQLLHERERRKRAYQVKASSSPLPTHDVTPSRQGLNVFVAVGTRDEQAKRRGRGGCAPSSG